MLFFSFAEVCFLDYKISQASIHEKNLRTTLLRTMGTIYSGDDLNTMSCRAEQVMLKCKVRNGDSVEIAV